MSWYLQALSKYAVFSGRARRKEYWMFTLFNLIIGFVLGLVEGLMGLGGDAAIGPLGGFYTLAIILPSIAVTVRRLHDTGKSGWWLFIAFVPFIGALAVLWFMIQEGQATDNQYGPDPKNPAGGPTYQPPQPVATPTA